MVADIVHHHSTDILAVAGRQDQAAFARLFAHFAPRVKSYMLRLGMTDAQAEDLAQEAMLSVWRKAHLFDPGKAEAATWIFTISRNLRIDALRRERHPEASEEELAEFRDEAPLADQRVHETERQNRLREAMRCLSDDQREVVQMSFFADLAHSAIAEKLNLPLGTVKSRLRLAMIRVRKALGEQEP